MTAPTTEQDSAPTTDDTAPNIAALVNEAVTDMGDDGPDEDGEESAAGDEGTLGAPDPAPAVAGSTPATAAAVTATPAGTPAPELEPEVETIDYTIDLGETKYNVPGLKFNSKTNTLHFTDPRGPARLQTLTRLGRAWEIPGGNRDQLQQARAEKQQQAREFDNERQESGMFMEQWQQLMDPRADPQTVVDRVMSFRDAWPDLQQRIQQRQMQQLRQELERAKSPAAQAPPQADLVVIAEQAHDAIVKDVQDVMQGEPWMAETTRAHILSVLTAEESIGNFVRQATRAEIEQGQPAGWLLDWPRVKKAYDQLTVFARDAHDRLTNESARLKPLEPVARTNQKILAKATPAAAPNPVASPRSAPTLTAAQSRAAAKRELDETIRNAFPD